MPILQKRVGTYRASTSDGAGNFTGTTYKNGHYYRGLNIVVNISVISTGDVTYTIEGLDPISGTAYTLLASAAKSSAAAFKLAIYPGLTETSNVDSSDVLPIWWRVKSTGTHTGLVHSVFYELVP